MSPWVLAGEGKQGICLCPGFLENTKTGKKKEILAYEILSTKIKIKENKRICLSYRAICESILKQLKCKFECKFSGWWLSCHHLLVK
jgi:hypothetical protein